MKHNFSFLCFLSSALLVFHFGVANASQLNDGDPNPGDANEKLEWEAEQPEVVLEDNLGLGVNVNDDSHFDEDVPAQERKKIDKHIIDQYLTETCEKIRSNRAQLPSSKISRATQYFTPMFEPGANGRLQKKDRRSCINIEGSCVVNDFLYNWSSKSEPWGKMYVRQEVPFKFGKGNGQSYYNKTNALDPCRTLAADPKHYPTGTVVYIPSMRNKICPQSGKTVDGCFIIGDVGSAIKGPARFDVFTGECANYKQSNSTCADPSNVSFIPAAGDVFYVVGRHNIWAKELREEVDMFIQAGWINRPIPPLPFPKPSVLR